MITDARVATPERIVPTEPWVEAPDDRLNARVPDGPIQQKWTQRKDDYKLVAPSTSTQDFHDITVGNNTAVVDGKFVPGYSAAKGWDPITGLGSPNAEKLLPDLIVAIRV